MYIASDSRISWDKIASFDYGKKVFAFNNHPDILGYAGDALFPSIVLNQIVEMADAGLLFEQDATSKVKFERIKGKLVSIFEKYPHDVLQITDKILQVVHGSRSHADGTFFCHYIEWRRDRGWSGRQVPIPFHSDILFCIGSGATEFNENFIRYKEGANKKTSRNVFHCFCDTLFNIQDPFCGGPPQLIGIYRKPESTAIKFGIIKNARRYLFGAPIDNLSNFHKIEWRNELFERCDGESMKKIANAMAQPNLLKRNK